MTQIENWKAKFIHDRYLELLEKTRQELHKAQDRLRDLGNDLFEARMMNVFVKGDDKLLLEEEKSFLNLEELEPQWEEAESNYRFWKERFERVSEYDYDHATLLTKIETEGEIDAILYDILYGEE
jgi:hypothetical protein